ncbi:M6 family metalloprotease domain-containing protein [Prevotella sp. oral taxon 317]|jgi:M6 family metalloprotease domain-containing protein|uniref:M6 family metalloprotease domain-containing protein n=1 Tax=Prevotella sp. oral taxon 317 TaxID=652721 RepID=UPI00030CE35A|nr:M6 family metalloprotease domain-containing protein [Prevotella sp. oral taxon 317]
MKKTVLILITLLCHLASHASKGWPYPITVSQPDGTQLTVRINGDADFNWVSTLDGVVLKQVGNGYYIANIDTNGMLSSSGTLAHDADKRSSAEQSLCKKQDVKAFLTVNTRPERLAATRGFGGKSSTSFFPHTGSPRAIVLLVQFANRPFKVQPRKAFNQYLNSMANKHQDFGNAEDRNTGSVKRYFSDMSGGKFKPQFDLYGPITMPKNVAYYGEGSSSMERYRELVSEACTMMDDSLDFSKYDADKDGNVDLVYIIYAGYGESVSSIDSTLWPKAFVCGTDIKKDGKYVRLAGISNELNGRPDGNYNSKSGLLINGVGLFCHEFSHCMGLPDFYPTVSPQWTTANDKQDFDAYDNQGMEEWDVMDNGIYLYNGYSPTAYTAWEREKMGWLTIETLTKEGKVELKSIDEGGKAYRIKNDKNTSGNEYYIVENIQAKGWNKKLPASGMMVSHVEYEPRAFSVFHGGDNSVNNIKKHPRMTIVPADGYLPSSYRKVPNSSNLTAPYMKKQQYDEQLAGDLYPGKSNVNRLTDAQNMVNYAPWTGGMLNKPIYNIALKNGIVTFDFLKDQTSTGIEQPESVTENNNEERIYTIDGRYVGTNLKALPKGVYIKGKKKVVVSR